MTQDQLFAKLLSDGLSPAEWRELKNLLADQPNAAEELQELRALEQSLRDNGLPAGDRADDFLQSVEDRVANVLAKQGPSKVATALGAHASFSSAVYLVGSLALLVGIAGTVLLFNPADDQTALQEAAIVETVDGNAFNHADDVNTVNDDNTEANAAAGANTETADNLPAEAGANGDLNTDAASNAPGPDAQADNIGEPESTALNVETQNGDIQQVDMLNRADREDPPDDLQRELKLMEDSLKSSLNAGDVLNGAMHARKLAIFWRERGSKYAENSSAKFREAIELAERAGAESYQAEIMGEYARLQASLGRKAEARQLLDNCIEILRRLNSSELSRWQAERARL